MLASNPALGCIVTLRNSSPTIVVSLGIDIGIISLYVPAETNIVAGDLLAKSAFT